MWSVVEACPENVLAVEAGELIQANPGACTMCAECESVCPEHAVSVHYHISWAEPEE
jgi:NAD-dependent dihydropyrimidine dehydrogenase PreA subunit